MCGREEKTRACDSALNRATRIAELNDDFRRGKASGKVAITAGVLAQGRHAVPAIMLLVQEFDDFGRDNDPYGEHDFGALDWRGKRIFWKIDYYSPDMMAGSEDPADPQVTARVLTILLAEEY